MKIVDIKYIIIGIALLLFVSCGQQQQAKSVVKDFVAQQLKKEVNYLEFSDVDSTRAISDSLVNVMRQKGPQGVRYQEKNNKTLLHVRAKYVLGNDTCSATFYLNPEATGVIAFKEN